MSWSTLATPVPSALIKAASTLKTAAGTVSSSMEAVNSQLALVQKLTAFAEDPVARAVGLAVSGVQAALQTLLEGPAGVHYLNVPIIKTTGNPAVPLIQVDDAFTNIAAFPLSGYLGSGGNAGFFRVVANSIFDAGDSSRPQYGPRDPFSALVVMFGSPQLGAVLDTALLLPKMYGGMFTGLDASVAPCPQNLTFSLVPKTLSGVSLSTATPLSGDCSYAVQLSWDPAAGSYVKPGFGLSRVDVKKVHIFRTEEGGAPSSAPYATLPFDPLHFVFVDRGTSKNKHYTYWVGYELETTESNGASYRLENSSTSNTVTVDTSKPVTKGPVFSHGTPPDWRAVTETLDLLPAVRDLVLYLKSYVDVLAHTVSSAQTGLGQMAATMALLLEESQAALTKLTYLANQLNSTLVEPPLGLYTLAMTGTGGVTDFLSQLQAALTDTSDPSRPPFDTGLELVGGCVLLAGASNPVDTAKFNLLVSLLGGSSDNPLKDAIATVDRVKATLPATPLQFSSSPVKIC